MDECPKCGSPFASGDKGCKECGIVFKTFKQYETMMNTHNRIMRFWSRVIEKKSKIISSTTILVALIVSLGPWTSDVIINDTGLVLQLLGIGTVIWGIEKTRTDFGLPTMKDNIKTFIKRVFGRQKEDNALTFNGISPGVKADFRPSKRFEISEDASSEERIKAVEKHMVYLDEVIINTQAVYGERFRQTAGLIENEAHLRESEDNSIREKLTVSETGGLHISAIGAAFLFFGVILGTIHQQIFDWWQAAGLIK